MPPRLGIPAGHPASPPGSELPHGWVPGRHFLHERPARRRAPPTTSVYYFPGQGRQALYGEVREQWEERYEGRYGFWRGVTDKAVTAYLEIKIDGYQMDGYQVSPSHLVIVE